MAQKGCRQLQAADIVHAWIVCDRTYTVQSTLAWSPCAAGENVFVQVSLDGTVRSSGLGIPPWNQFVGTCCLLYLSRDRFTQLSQQLLESYVQVTHVQNVMKYFCIPRSNLVLHWVRVCMMLRVCLPQMIWPLWMMCAQSSQGNNGPSTRAQQSASHPWTILYKILPSQSSASDVDPCKCAKMRPSLAEPCHNIRSGLQSCCRSSAIAHSHTYQKICFQGISQVTANMLQLSAR